PLIFVGGGVRSVVARVGGGSVAVDLLLERGGLVLQSLRRRVDAVLRLRADHRRLVLERAGRVLGLVLDILGRCVAGGEDGDGGEHGRAAEHWGASRFRSRPLARGRFGRKGKVGRFCCSALPGPPLPLLLPGAVPTALSSL